MNLHQLLLNKAMQNKLGHFYILETNAKQPHNHLVKFIHQFIKDYFHKIENQQTSLHHLMDHPDVFVMGDLELNEESSDKMFKVEQSELLNRFFEFKPIQSKRKFAVITQGHRVSQVIANKWLKILEEPIGHSTIFLLNPKRQKLLSTLNSRAIQLRIRSESQKVSEIDQTFFTKSLETGFAEFLENQSSPQEHFSQRLSQLIEKESLSHAGPSKFELIEWLKKFQEMENFNQPSATKWYFFKKFLDDSYPKK